MSGKIKEAVADAAEWLYHNAGSRIQTLQPLSPARIIALYECNKSASDERERVESARKYSDEHLRNAYMAGWEASGQGWNGEHPAMAHELEQWAAERDEALRAIKCDS